MSLEVGPGGTRGEAGWGGGEVFVDYKAAVWWFFSQTTELEANRDWLRNLKYPAATENHTKTVNTSFMLCFFFFLSKKMLCFFYSYELKKKNDMHITICMIIQGIIFLTNEYDLLPLFVLIRSFQLKLSIIYIIFSKFTLIFF